MKRLSLFGSVLSDHFRPESDIDVLIELGPQAQVGLFEICEMESELSRILGGRRVDLRTEKDLSLRFRSEVKASLLELYAA